MKKNLRVEHSLNDSNRGKTEVIGEKPVPVQLCLPQILHRKAWDLHRAFAVTGN